MKIKLLALTFSLVFFASLTATSIAQVISTPSTITVVDGDKDKDKDKKTSKTSDKKAATGKKACDEKKSCCNGKVMLKDDSCKDKKSDKDKR